MNIGIFAGLIATAVCVLVFVWLQSRTKQGQQAPIDATGNSVKTSMADDNFCEYVRALIGDELRLIGATHIKDSRYGEGFDETEVCFFSVADKIIAIDYSPRDGAACSITDAQSAELSQHNTWDGLWHLLKMDTDIDTDEGLSAYLEMFPNGHDEFIKFIGTSLVKYFGGTK